MRATLNAAELRAAHCVHASAGDKLTDSEVSAQIAAGAPAWQAHGEARSSATSGSPTTTARWPSSTRWPGVAHAEDHHPDLAVGYSRCVVRFNTHSVGGISINDFICAAKVDALPGATG